VRRQQSKSVTKGGKAGATSDKQKFIIDYSGPANDNVFDGAAFEKCEHLVLSARPQLG
jgi:hypothetical protein